MNESSAELATIVWTAFAFRSVVFLVAVFFILQRSLKIRKEIEKRKFAGRYQATAILRGVFSPRPGWEEPFDSEDIEVLRKTRAFLILVVVISLLVILVNQKARAYVDSEFERRGYIES